MAAALWVLIALFPCAAPVALAAPLDFLFVAFDNGESTQLGPAIDLMHALNSGEMAVLCLGEPAISKFAGKPYAYTLADLGIGVRPKNGREDPKRDGVLTPNELAKVKKRWPEVKTVVPGMAYKMQSQIAQAYKSATVECIQDGFGLWNEEWAGGRFFMKDNVCTEVLVPSTAQQKSLMEAHPTVKTRVVGAPAIEVWRQEAGDVGLVRHAREALYGNSTSKSVLMAGGYGDGEILTSEIFCNASKLLPDWEFAYGPHPGLGDGLAEMRRLFRESGCPRVIIASDKEIHLEKETLKMNTLLASASSHATVSRFSTVGGQSLYIGVPHAYIDGPHPSKKNIFSDYIPTFKDERGLAGWISKSKHFDSSVLDDLLPGLGGDAGVLLAHRLLEQTDTALSKRDGEKELRTLLQLRQRVAASPTTRLRGNAEGFADLDHSLKTKADEAVKFQ